MQLNFISHSRRAILAMLAIATIATSCGGGESTADVRVATIGSSTADTNGDTTDDTTGDTTAGATVTSEGAAPAETTANATLPDVTAGGTSCFGVTLGQILEIIGNDATSAYQVDLGSPTDWIESSSCSASLDAPAGALLTEAMSIEMRIEVFDPTRHVVGSAPSTYDTLRANNVECCNVVDIAGIGEAAFSWTNLDVEYRRSSAVLFRQGDLTGAAYLRIGTLGGTNYGGWDAVMPEIDRWLQEVANLMAAEGLSSDKLPPPAETFPPMTTAAPATTAAP